MFRYGFVGSLGYLGIPTALFVESKINDVSNMFITKILMSSL